MTGSDSYGTTMFSTNSYEHRIPPHLKNYATYDMGTDVTRGITGESRNITARGIECSVPEEPKMLIGDVIKVSKKKIKKGKIPRKEWWNK